MKKLIILIIALQLFSLSSFANLDLDKAREITSQDLFQALDKIERLFPNQVKKIQIGTSVNGHPIYVLQVTNNIQDFNAREKSNSEKKNILLIAGLHSKEVIAPVAFTKLINKELINFIDNMKEEHFFNHYTLHFLPLLNPDGFDLAKFGNYHEIFGYNFNRYLKANTNGVDLNNNFPDFFYDIKNNHWSSIEAVAAKPSIYRSTKPSVAYYWGTRIQPETQSLIDYMKKYYFEFFIDIHSQGNFIYWDHFNLSKQFREDNLQFAKTIQRISDLPNGKGLYQLAEPSLLDAPHGYGYSTAYYGSLYNNPTMTLEVGRLSNLPDAKKSDYEDVMNRFKDFFTEIMDYEQKKYPHRVYIDQQIFGDYSNKVMAKAIAKRYKGIYLYDEGPIKNYSGDVIDPIIFKGLTFFFNEQQASIYLEKNRAAND